jgi:hypothetical protein
MFIVKRYKGAYNQRDRGGKKRQDPRQKKSLNYTKQDAKGQDDLASKRAAQGNICDCSALFFQLYLNIVR